ncbi:MAG: hypothetical protein IKY65_04580 [Rikenellaceae bacterium]|nr:hypothetical protein [Rikenellaceae bacterium]
MAQQMSLNEQAAEILRIASEHGVEQNFFFLTTFKRYQVQIKILADLEKTINAEGNTVTKEYVKGRKNVYTHPAIGEYNKTSTAANQTVQTLMKIVMTMRDDDSDTDGGSSTGDELMDFLRGRRT